MPPGDLPPVERPVVGREEREGVGVDAAAPLDGQADPVRGTPVRGAEDGGRRIHHNGIAAPEVDEGDAADRPATGLGEVVLPARELEAADVGLDEARGGEDVGRVERELQVWAPRGTVKRFI